MISAPAIDRQLRHLLEKVSFGYARHILPRPRPQAVAARVLVGSLGAGSAIATIPRSR